MHLISNIFRRSGKNGWKAAVILLFTTQQCLCVFVAKFNKKTKLFWCAVLMLLRFGYAIFDLTLVISFLSFMTCVTQYGLMYVSFNAERILIVTYGMHFIFPIRKHALLLFESCQRTCF